MSAKYLYALFVLIALVLLYGGIIYYNDVSLGVPSLLPEAREAHLYGNPHVFIGRVVLRVFYIVPKNKIQGVSSSTWRSVLADTVERAARFHNLQFRGTSQLTYFIYRNPVYLENEDSFYDTANTHGGNPHGLVAVAEEVERRVFKPGGDLYDPSLIGGAGEYTVMGLVYEGSGASGGRIYESPLTSPADIAAQIHVSSSSIYKVGVDSAQGFFLLNRRFLSDSALPAYGASVFYHEFGHAIGLPDAYEVRPDFPQDILLTEDIMGGGRYRPLENTYIGNDFLKEMGVF